MKFFFVSRDFDPITLVQFRMTLTCLIIGGVLAVVRPGLLRVKVADLPFLALYGVLGQAATQALYFLSIRESSVTVAVFLNYLAPIVTAVYEIRVLRRRPGKATFAVLVAAVAGSLLLVTSRGGGLATTPAGLFFGLGSAFALAFYSLAGRHALTKHSPWTLLFWATAAGSLLWAILRPPWVVLAYPWTLTDWGFFLYLAIFTGVIPFGLFLTGLRHMAATSAILTSTLEPVWATFLAAIFLHDTVSASQLLGCLFILGAIIALQVVPGAALEDAEQETPSSAASAG